MKNKNIEVYYVYNSDIINSLSELNYNNKSDNITKSFVSKANLLNDCQNLQGTIIGSSTNRFDINNNTVYVSRQDNLFINMYGSLIFNFNFVDTYDDINKLPISNNIKKFVGKSTFNSGIYENKDVEIQLDIYDTFRIYTISYYN